MTIAMEAAAFYRAKAIELTVIADELTNPGRQAEWRTMTEIWKELAKAPQTARRLRSAEARLLAFLRRCRTSSVTRWPLDLKHSDKDGPRNQPSHPAMMR